MQILRSIALQNSERASPVVVTRADFAVSQRVHLSWVVNFLIPIFFASHLYIDLCFHHEIPSIEGPPDPLEFHRSYVSRNWPCVLKGMDC